MDIATLFGFCAAVGVILMAIMTGGTLGSIINVPSLLIVFGGSAGVVMMKFSLGQFFGAIKIALVTLLYKSEKPTEIIAQVVDMAEQARKGGIIALENVEIKNKFMKQGVQYLVDGLEPEVVESTLTKDMAQTLERHMLGQQIFKAIGDVGPAMGMIGTLIGLIQMLSNLSDPSTLGPAMAVAMLTTLYGAMLANMFALPIADKLELRSKEERILKSLIIDAILSIQEGQNPRVINDILKTYLPGSKRDTDKKDSGDK